MNILWASNYTSNSGYANQARLFIPQIERLGHRVTVFELGTSAGAIATIDGLKVLPTANDRLGHDRLHYFVKETSAHAVMSLIDVWALNPDVWGGVNWYPLTPVDTLPVAPAITHSLKGAKFPIAFSQYGHSQLSQAGFKPSYLPLAYDSRVFYPRSKQEARRMVGWNEDDFYALFVGVNNNLPSRKGIFELLAGWQTFKQSVTTPAHLYLHTSPIGAGQFTGVHIPAACQLLGIGDSVVMTAEQDYLTGFKETYLSALYAAADVLVLPSRGEGFGLPLIEAQAVGTPVITTDFAAGAELVGAGWKIEGEPEWSNQNALVMKAGIKSLADALQQAYQHRDNPILRDSAVNFAKSYDIDEVCNRYLAPVMARIADSVLGLGV